jgi:hypothetical protein
MRSHPLPWLLAVLSLLSACSLLVDFDPEGQPCDGGNQCLQGYVCTDTRCVPSPGADGGTGGSSLCEDPAGCPELPAEAR